MVSDSSGFVPVTPVVSDGWSISYYLWTAGKIEEMKGLRVFPIVHLDDAFGREYDVELLLLHENKPAERRLYDTGLSEVLRNRQLDTLLLTDPQDIERLCSALEDMSSSTIRYSLYANPKRGEVKIVREEIAAEEPPVSVTEPASTNEEIQTCPCCGSNQLTTMGSVSLGGFVYIIGNCKCGVLVNMPNNQICKE